MNVKFGAGGGKVRTFSIWCFGVGYSGFWFAGAIAEDRVRGFGSVYVEVHVRCEVERDQAVWTNGLGVTRRGWV